MEIRERGKRRLSRSGRKEDGSARRRKGAGEGRVRPGLGQGRLDEGCRANGGIRERRNWVPLRTVRCLVGITDKEDLRLVEDICLWRSLMEQVVGAKIRMLCNSLNNVNLIVMCDYHKDDHKVNILTLT